MDISVSNLVTHPIDKLLRDAYLYAECELGPAA